MTTLDVQAAAACPICNEAFSDADAYRDHLGFEHALFDDDGTETNLPVPALASRPVPTDRWAGATDERADDEGWVRPDSRSATHERSDAFADRAESGMLPDAWFAVLPVAPVAARPAFAKATPFIAVASALLLVAGVVSVLTYDTWSTIRGRVVDNVIVASREGDLDMAIAAMMQPADLGAGWATMEENLAGDAVSSRGIDGESTGDAELDAAMNSCQQVEARKSGRGNLGVSVTRTFALENRVTYAHGVAVLGSVAGASDEVNLFPKEADCWLPIWAKYVASGAGPGARVASAVVSPLAVPAVGDQRAGRSMAVVVAANGIEVLVRVDATIIRSGRLVAFGVAFTTCDECFGAAAFSRSLDRAATRMRDAQGTAPAASQ